MWPTDLYQCAALPTLAIGRFPIGVGVIEAGKLRMFAMGEAIAVRQDFTAAKLRRLATRTKDVARPAVLAIAAIPDGAPRAEAARIGGMDRQTLRDWVIRFNEQGPEGLINMVSPGSPPKLDEEHGRSSRVWWRRARSRR